MPDVECLGSVTGVRIENLKLLYDEHSNCANVRLSVGGPGCKTVGRVSKAKKKDCCLRTSEKPTSRHTKILRSSIRSPRYQSKPREFELKTWGRSRLEVIWRCRWGTTGPSTPSVQADVNHSHATKPLRPGPFLQLLVIVNGVNTSCEIRPQRSMLNSYTTLTCSIHSSKLLRNSGSQYTWLDNEAKGHIQVIRS